MAIFSQKQAGQVEVSNLPRHVAVIMDGNGRWAQKRGLPRTAGHKAGAENFRTIATYCKDLGIDYLTVYAFSTENWKRPQGEVDAIMGLLDEYLHESIETMARDNIRLRFLGDVSVLSPRLRALIEETDELTRHITGFQANICLNYGGRDELVRAARRFAVECVEGKRSPEELTEESFPDYLWSAGLPDPELLIRPGGELRVSNFLLWQCAYSEIYVTDTLWPDFGKDELDKALAWYRTRDRRFGGLSNKK
ncbi:MAG: isoprenyl transferase [Ruminococcaceae bacterium]|jgi:undecaprenyl diphosphate synthase|nr:isoprenyl transferase [Oscillospiraceae bacterium]